MKNRLIPPRGSPVKAEVRLRMYGWKELKEEEYTLFQNGG